MTVEIEKAVKYIRKSLEVNPSVAIILGSGLGRFADHLTSQVRLPARRIPNYPASTVTGHRGYLVFGFQEDVPVAAVQGRTHIYEGYSPQRVCFIIRIFQALGIRNLILTNAAGGINSDFKPGDFMLISDHINGMFRNPLIGSPEYDGERFPDMSRPYAEQYFERIENLAQRQNITLHRGVLYATTGPSYETAAEIRMINRAGGDAVSMSTIPEVITARQSGMEVVGISCITNPAAGLSSTPLDHDEVTAAASRFRSDFSTLIRGIIQIISKY